MNIGLTTKQNRDIPPLHYELVHQLRIDFPQIEFIINGGIKTLREAWDHMFQDYNVEKSVLLGLMGNNYIPGSMSWDRNKVIQTVWDAEPNTDLPVDGNLSLEMDRKNLCDTCNTATESAQELFNNTLDTEYESEHEPEPRTEAESSERVSLPPVHGVMIGRAAYSNPLMLATVDQKFYGQKNLNPTRRELINEYLEYCDIQQSEELGMFVYVCMYLYIYVYEYKCSLWIVDECRRYSVQSVLI